MKLAKLKSSFDIYKAELSYAELVAIQAACASAGDPIADDVSKAIEWYVANELPGPGEDESPAEEAKEDKGDEGDEPMPAAPASEPPALEPAPAEEVDVQAAADEILDEPPVDAEEPMTRRGAE